MQIVKHNFTLGSEHFYLFFLLQGGVSLQKKDKSVIPRQQTKAYHAWVMCKMSNLFLLFLGCTQSLQCPMCMPGNGQQVCVGVVSKFILVFSLAQAEKN